MASNGEHMSDNKKSIISKSLKRRRDADQQILDNFWLICDSSESKRNKSLKVIIEILVKQNETKSSSDLLYCLERLIRGMASARQFARHGFCVLLTQLLCIFEDKVSLESVYSLSETHLGKINEISNHDSVIGWSLVIGSVLKSKRLTFHENEDIWRKTFDVLYVLGLKKPYIELVVCQLIRDFFILLVNNKNLFQKIVWTKLEDELKTENNYKPFVLYICLILIQYFPKFCSKNKVINNVLETDSLQKLSIVIKETTGYHPLVHPMNRELVKAYITNNNGNNFPLFWNKIVEETLFIPNQIEKGFLGFEFIKIALPLLQNVEEVSIVLSSSFIRLFIQSLSAKTHPLHKASEQLCEFFIDFMKKINDSKLQIAIVNCFIKQPGSLMFDDISKSKFFSNLLRSLNSESIKEWINRLKTSFLLTNKIDSNDIMRIRCIQQMSNVSKSITSSDDIDILWSTIKFLFFNAYFEVNDNFESDDQNLKRTVIPISEKLRTTCRDSFRGSFNHLSHLGSKTTKQKLLCEVQTLTSMVEFANGLIKNENITCLTDSQFLESWNTIVKRLSRLSKKLKSKPSKENEIRIFILLHSMFAIQLFEEYQEIENILPDLSECMKRAIDEETDGESDSSPVWADVLTDLILSMLTTSSKLTKNVLFSSFKHICNHLTGIGLQRLIEAIIPTNDKKLFSENDGSDSDNESNISEEVEKSESESESESEEENQNSEVDEKFRNDVINALGPAADNDDEESVYLSDNEMFQIDETLAAVFQTKYNNKKELIEKQMSINIFRIRCLELIQIFLNNKEISVAQVLQLIEPIVSVAKSTSQSKQNQMSSKSLQLIIQMSKLKDFNTNDKSIPLEDIKQTLDYLLSVLFKTSHLELQKALTSLTTWTIHISKKLNPNDNWYIPAIESSLKSFFEKNNCHISPNLFKCLIEAHNEIGVGLFQVFLDYSFSEEIRPFKKSAAIEILLNLCRNKHLRNTSNFTPFEHLEKMREKTIKVLCIELDNDKLKAQYVSELLKLLQFSDKYLKEMNAHNKISNNDCQELSSKLRALTRIKRKKLNNKPIIKKLIANEN